MQVGETVSRFEDLENKFRSCSECKDILSAKFVDKPTGERVEPRPIVTELQPKQIMLIGQAPGITEYIERKPFQGQAGKDIRKAFADCGVDQNRFDKVVHSSAIVMCFPGRKMVPHRSRPGFRYVDERPSGAMVKNCQPLLKKQIDVIDPQLIVLLGRFPLQAFLRMRGQPSNDLKLATFVGRTEYWDRRKIIVLPHTSGSSFWLNDPVNRSLFDRAKDLLGAEIANLKIQETDPRPE